MSDFEVLLIKPGFSYIYGKYASIAKFYEYFPPIGLLSISAMLERNEIPCKILDAEIENYNEKDIISAASALGLKVIGLSVTTPEVKYVLNICKQIKEKNINSIIVLGGAHAIVRPEELIKEESITAVCCGEGETSLSEYVKALRDNNLNKRKIANLYYKQDGEIITPPENRFFENINDFPFLPLHKISHKNYLFSAPHPINRRVPALSMITVRGCPHQCIFCFKSMGNTVRFMDPDRVVREIEHVYNIYGVRFIYFYDDSFIINRARTTEICKQLISKKLSLNWACYARANELDKEILTLLKEAGCIRISIGVESGSQKTLNIIKKNTTIRDYEKAFKIAHDLGIETRGSFIIGNPYETKKDIMKTIEFSKSLDIDIAAFKIMTPYPGTKVYEMASKGEGISLTSKNYDDYLRCNNSTIKLPNLSKKELDKLLRYAYISFYLNFKKLKYLWNRNLISSFLRLLIISLWERLPRKMSGTQ